VFATADGGWEALKQDFDNLTALGWIRLTLERLTFAALFGGRRGWQRERIGKAAGLRTHMLVAVGTAFFVLSCQLERSLELSHVIQGIAAGIGFIGGGVILKLSEEKQIKGVTTAAGLWLTASVGVAVGLGRLGAALVCTLLGLAILTALYRLDLAIGGGTDEVRAASTPSPTAAPAPMPWSPS
jgi:putative Mg2+ transporter-C (MgtC) family protein